MTRSSAIADCLSRVVFLLHDTPEDKEGQKSAFRALLVRVSDQPVSFATTDGRLLVDGEPAGPDVYRVGDLRRHLLAHGIGELKVPGSLSPSQLLTIVRALGARPGTFPRLQQLADHLVAAGIAGVEITPPIPASISAPPTLEPPSPELAPRISAPVNLTIEESEILALGPDALNEESVGLLHFATLELQSIGHLDELLIVLEQDPDSAKAGDVLNELLAAGDGAAQKEQWRDLVRAAAVLVRLEGRVQDESQRRMYNIALRRLVSRSSLEHVALLLRQQEQRTEALAILRRIGADATEVLIHLLISAQDVGDRRVYFNALTQMTEGTDLLVHMLSHDEWFVVRNVAELCGEMKLEAAVPTLAKLVTHADERVRRAATSALAHIASPATIEPLRRALQDTSPAVRLHAATALDGPRVKNLVPALSRLLEEESHPEVQREMLHALGRIGTADAVDVLIRASQPPRGLFKKKHLAIRLDAIEGLRLAGDPQAVATLANLEKDKEDEVRRVAQRALRNLKSDGDKRPVTGDK